MGRSFWFLFAGGLFWLFFAVVIIFAQEPLAPESPAAGADPAATPTIDRLAAPPTVPAPTQADEGAQHYWLWCQPCHGDYGQGLTDEWRMQYPEDHQYCWESGCHGEVPYNNGFTLPKHVPPLIGKGTLLRYQTMGELFEVVHQKMPFEYPGALNEEEALAVVAFLAQQHGKWDGTRLTLNNVDEIRLQPTPQPTPSAAETVLESGLALLSDNALILSGLILGLVLLGGILLWLRRD
jgi:hypothetical protein